MNVRNILVPTDFSEPSLEALKMARKFVELYGSTVDLIHVVPMMSYFSESLDHLGMPLDMDHDLYPKALENANKSLHDIASKYLPKEHTGQLINLIGRKVSSVVAERAGSGQYDLLIMSCTGGHHTDTIRSHITERIIRYSKIPVLSLSKAFGEKDIEQILVTADGSEESFAAIVQAFEMARRFEANLKLLHVIEPYTLGMEVLPPVMDDEEKIYHSMLEHLSEYLKERPETKLSVKRSSTKFEDYLVFQDGAESVSVRMDTIIEKGFSAHFEIADYANKNADLVVMSTHGRTGVARLLLGSTTETVAKHLERPLLTVRP